MKTIHILIVFILLAIVQISIPLQMIWDQEEVLMSGAVYKFKTRPIDPIDPFKGKYITLRFEMNSFKTSDSTYVYGDNIHVYIKKDSLGFAKVLQISKDPLEINADYILAKVTNTYGDEVAFQLPFNRFYMKETKAYDAEKAYAEVNSDSLKENVHALVSIKEGRSVLKDVIIDGIPIQEYVEH